MRFLFFAAVVLPVFGSKSTQLDTIIYQYLPGSDSQNTNLSFCSRRLNQTDQVGCQSERNRGNRGTLIYIGANQTELMSYLTENDKIDSEIGIYFYLIILKLQTFDFEKCFKPLANSKTSY